MATQVARDAQNHRTSLFLATRDHEQTTPYPATANTTRDADATTCRKIAAVDPSLVGCYQASHGDCAGKSSCGACFCASVRHTSLVRGLVWTRMRPTLGSVHVREIASESPAAVSMNSLAGRDWDAAGLMTRSCGLAHRCVPAMALRGS